MKTCIHLDFGVVGAVASTLQDIKAGSVSGTGFDLSGLRSDLVTSAGRAYASGWSDVLDVLHLTSSGLASGVDATANDFAAAEQTHLDSIATSIGELDR